MYVHAQLNVTHAMTESAYTRYYLHQSGHGSEYGRFGSPYISPYVLQRGYGIGGIFATVARYLTPVFGALKDTAVTAGKNVMRDIWHKPFADILKEQGKVAASTLTDRAAKQVHEWIGAGRRKGIKRGASQKGGTSSNSSSMAKRARTSAASSKRKQTVKRRRKNTANSSVATGAGRRQRKKQTKTRRRKRTLDIFT